MAVLRVKVTYSDDKEVEVKVTPKVQLAFERQYGLGLPQASKDMRNEYLFYLAWRALQFAGHETRDFEEFVDSIDDVDIAGRDAEDPTKSERSVG